MNKYDELSSAPRVLYLEAKVGLCGGPDSHILGKWCDTIRADNAVELSLAREEVAQHNRTLGFAKGHAGLIILGRREVRFAQEEPALIHVCTEVNEIKRPRKKR